MGWFSYKAFLEWKSEGRYFISRIQKQINPLILKVNKGDKIFERMRFQEIPWDKYDGEVDLEVKPFRYTKGSVYRLKDGSILTLRMKGSKVPGKDKWYWYIYSLPNCEGLSFKDINSLYRARWQIEECFREIKQSLGGDRVRLRHPVSVQNHILLMLIGYLICRGYLMKIALVYRKSIRGFMLDNCLRGIVGELFKGIIFVLVRDPCLSYGRLKEISEAFCDGAYSSRRDRSSRIVNLGKAMKKLNRLA